MGQLCPLGFQGCIQLYRLDETSEQSQATMKAGDKSAKNDRLVPGRVDIWWVRRF